MLSPHADVPAVPGYPGIMNAGGREDGRKLARNSRSVLPRKALITTERPYCVPRARQDAQRMR